MFCHSVTRGHLGLETRSWHVLALTAAFPIAGPLVFDAPGLLPTNTGHCREPWASGGGVEQQGHLITCSTRSRDPNQAQYVGDDGGH